MSILVAGWRRRYAAFPIVLAFAGCASHGGASPEDEKHDAEHEAHVVVKTEPARLGTLTETVEGLGRCEALPDHIATLTPAVEGHVHELLVAQGDVGQERAADRRARQGRRAGRSGGEDGNAGRAQSLAGPAQVAPAPRGAEGQRAGGRAGQGGGRAGQVPRRGYRIAPQRWQPGVQAAALRCREGPGGGRAPAAGGRGNPARR